MARVKKISLPLILVFLLLWFGLPAALGAYLEPRIEKTLTDLFGMKFSVDRLRVNPLSGMVSGSSVVFGNPPGYSDRPHLIVSRMDVRLLWPSLFRKDIRILRIDLDHPVYYLERREFEPGRRVNAASAWWNYIKSRRKPSPPNDDKRWTLLIDHIKIHRGTFIYHETNFDGSLRKRFFFSQLDGYYDRLSWPTVSPSRLSQPVRLAGLFGEKYPAPFWIEGRANFITSQVSFDLNGQIDRGNVLEHRRIWEGLPIDFVRGGFSLVSHTVCVRREMVSKNLLVLRDVRVVPDAHPTEFIWGVPMTGVVAFIQNQRRIRLNVRVRGNIKDPRFDFQLAFRRAFERALERRVERGVHLITTAPGLIARQTFDLVGQAPERVIEGLRGIVGTFNQTAKRGHSEAL
jgi:hypothetical protein